MDNRPSGFCARSANLERVRQRRKRRRKLASNGDGRLLGKQIERRCGNVDGRAPACGAAR